MCIELAKKLKVGQQVKADGELCTVLSIGEEVHKNIYGVQYVWVLVQLKTHKSVYPSSKLK